MGLESELFDTGERNLADQLLLSGWRHCWEMGCVLYTSARTCRLSIGNKANSPACCRAAMSPTACSIRLHNSSHFMPPQPVTGPGRPIVSGVSPSLCSALRLSSLSISQCSEPNRTRDGEYAAWLGEHRTAHQRTRDNIYALTAVTSLTLLWGHDGYLPLLGVQVRALYLANACCSCEQGAVDQR